MTVVDFELNSLKVFNRVWRDTAVIDLKIPQYAENINIDFLSVYSVTVAVKQTIILACVTCEPNQIDLFIAKCVIYLMLRGRFEVNLILSCIVTLLYISVQCFIEQYYTSWSGFQQKNRSNASFGTCRFQWFSE